MVEQLKKKKNEYIMYEYKMKKNTFFAEILNWMVEFYRICTRI